MYSTTTPKVTVIDPVIMTNPIDVAAQEERKLRVAAYARVSTDQEEQQNSYEAQVSYYTSYIKGNLGWEFVGVYADEGISGTNTKKREGFNRMIADAKAGKIDLILTKSISRFARNTVDSLSITRDLKAHNVEVRFEKENLSSLDPKAEMMHTILSSLAQEESRSISENVRWGQRKSMMDGKVHIAYSSFLGYQKGADGKLEIVEEEAEIVRTIYRMFLDEDKTIRSIAEYLTEHGIQTPMGKSKWSVSTVKSILSNEKYKGDALLQKTFTVDYLSKTVKKNEGERPQYYVKGSHPAIISPERFDLVQKLMAERSENRSKLSNNSPFTTRVVCSDCGGFYGKKARRGKSVWYCNRRYDGDHVCDTPIVPEEVLKASFMEVIKQEMLLHKGESGTDNQMRNISKLERNRDAASESYDAAVEELKSLIQISGQMNHDLFREKHARMCQKVEERKKALAIAEDAIISETARRERWRRFNAAIENLSPETVEFSDELFVATCEKIMVSKQNAAKNYSLKFILTNGSETTIEKK